MQTTTSPAADAVTEITREELLRRLNDPGLILVDVLPAASYAARHIRHAVSLPVEEVRARARDVLPDPGREVVVYCGGFT
jgi:rhodanese-related sulfurtransferase